MLDQDANNFVNEGDPLSASALNKSIREALPKILIPGAFQTGGLYLGRRNKNAPASGGSLLLALSMSSISAATGWEKSSWGEGDAQLIGDSGPDGTTFSVVSPLFSGIPGSYVLWLTKIGTDFVVVRGDCVPAHAAIV